MQAASEAGGAGEVLALLEGGGAGAQGAARALAALFGAVREPWYVRGLLAYHARTGSARALDLLARAPEPHARHLLDALLELLRGDRPARRQALAALAPLAARRAAPPAPALVRELLRAARQERAALPLVHALLALAALLPAAPALAHPHWPELADALLRPAAPDPPPARAHLQLARLALFHALYATHPCTLLDALRDQLSAAGGGGPARDALERGLAPLLHSVRLHPALVTGSRQREADAARWARLELHDVVAEARRLALPAAPSPSARPDDAPSPAPVHAPAPSPRLPSPAPGSAALAARAAATLRPGVEPWFALVERAGADSAPHTPLPADAEAAEPPEAAVEATPENTPAKETRAQFRFPSDSGAVRAIGRRSRPPSPPRKETSPPAGGGGGDAYAARISRVMSERRSGAADSPVPFGAGPVARGGGVARPEPRAPAAADAEPLNGEDREVLELTARAERADAWPPADEGALQAPDPRRGAAAPRAAPRPAPRPPPRRPASCSPPRSARRASVAVQTVDVWPEPYEFLIADFYRQLPDDPRKQVCESAEGGAESGARPCERLDAYLAELYAGRAPAASAASAPRGDAAEQLALVHAQLMYERWRREAHAERNRRLLGRCRQARALDLQNAALRERVRGLARERDELAARLAAARARLAAAPAAGAAAAEAEAGAAAGERAARLRAELDGERAARAHAEAALREAEAARAADAAELQRARGDAAEAARHVQALARAALSAERRVDHVRRLRRELLVLGEREARLAGAARAGAGVGAGGGEAGGEEAGALRAAVARLEAEAGAGAARAEAAAARAHELEGTLAARDAALAELKRGARDAAEEHAARLRALQDKYEALMRVVRAGEAAHLRRLAAPPGPAPM